MKRSDDIRCIDELIGEAVMTLLESDGPLNTQALTDELGRMASEEQNVIRRQSIFGAISEVIQSIDAYRHRTDRGANVQQNASRSLFEHCSPARKH
ncbi:hypothetical protein SAMN05216516_101417 [Izhakiella capsodis]|uniref:Biofilm development protein YmgB/AriR n=1 Tax=Izhakiella capsodis TaxID=1367852 RepID=A0A1I4UXF5_9GAMM|nr:hypothetical protein [Izhakiella capsodis]SFM93621.1 hypothetical protein SAMN05216516_101417 [Izhakiella capsodis]